MGSTVSFQGYSPGFWPVWFYDFCAQGYFAVDLFFILSGFIIAYNYLADFRNLTVSRHLHFVGMRLARVYPLYVVLLLLFLVNPVAIQLGASQPLDGVRYDPMYLLA